MYATFEYAPGRFQIAVPPLEAIPRPFGLPANVWVLDGPLAAVVDTGFAGGRDALVAALRELGVAPARVGKVLLTSALPPAVGNIELFPNATVHAVGTGSHLALAAAQRALRDELVALTRELAEGPEGHPDWSADEAELALELYGFGLPDDVAIVGVESGAEVRAAGATLRCIAAPGYDRWGAAWHDEAAGELFGGQTLSRSAAGIIRDPDALTDGLAALSRTTPERILPATGGVERSYVAVFRAQNLALSNLVQNVPFALDGPTAVARIAYRDIGYWPRDLVRFAAHVARFRSVLDGLVAAGVGSRDGEGAWATYTLARPPRA